MFYVNAQLLTKDFCLKELVGCQKFVNNWLYLRHHNVPN